MGKANTAEQRDGGKIRCSWHYMDNKLVGKWEKVVSFLPSKG
jgi:hypothetical protein